MYSTLLRVERETIVPIAHATGLKMRDPLARLFAFAKFDPSLIENHGALSLDVGYGPEISALRPYQPKRHIVSEPLSWWGERRVYADLLRRDVLETIGDCANLSIVDGDPLDGIDHVTSLLKTQVGLVTMLNVHPTRLGNDWLFITGLRAGDVLTPGGLMVLSVREGYTELDEDYIAKVREEHRKLMTYGPPSVTYQYYSEAYSEAGTQYILAEKSTA